MLRSFTVLNTKGEVASSRLFSMSLPKPIRPIAKSFGAVCLICQMLRDEAHREHVVGEEGELVFAVHVVRLESVPQKLDVLLLLRGLERERQVVGEFGGFFHEYNYSTIFDCMMRLNSSMRSTRNV